MLPPHFSYVNGILHIEDVSCEKLSEDFGTPLYVYSKEAISDAYKAYVIANGERQPVIHAAVKANPNIGVLSLLAKLGSSFDIASVGELERVLTAGGKAENVTFAGVGKRADELEAALKAGIKCFNVESTSELKLLNEVAGKLGMKAPIALRVNPDVDAHTHPYIATGLKQNKFGIAFDEALETYRLAFSLPHLQVTGIASHIGSQITDVAPYLEALDKILDLVETVEKEGIVIDHVDIGGGLGIRYDAEKPPAHGDFIRTIFERLEERGHVDRQLWLQPGRSLVGNAGVLLTRVIYLKQGAAKNFAIVDAGMNDMTRPALYGAYHNILSVKPREGEVQRYDVVGPVCESSDFLGRDRDFAIQVLISPTVIFSQEGDLLAVLSCGAYGSSMSSTFNSRPKAAEVIVEGTKTHLVRRRETLKKLFDLESVLPEINGIA